MKALALKVGRAIARRRKEMGLSQEAFSERVDYHRTYVGITERGERNITIYTLRSFAEALGTTSSELLKVTGLQVAF